MIRSRSTFVLLALLALCACEREKPRSPSPTTAPTGTPPPAPVATRPASPPAAAPAQAPATVAAVGGACRSGELTLKRIATEAAAGARFATFALSSVAPAACTLAGYPTVVLYDANGRKLAVRVVQTEQAYAEAGGPPAPVTLAPAGRAVFHLAWGAVASDAGPCLTAARVQVTPPGGDQALEVEERMEVCGGQLRVSPVRAELVAGAVKPTTKSPAVR